MQGPRLWKLASFSALAVVVFLTPSRAAAQAMATNSAVVSPMGLGTNLSFLDIIGRNNLASAPSYSVIEFSSGDLGLGTVSEVDSLTLSLTQSLFGASSRGLLQFLVTDDTTTSINAADSPLVFDMSDVAGLNGQLSDVFLLGTGEFDVVRSGTVDTFAFAIDPSSAVGAYLVNQINAGGTIRIIVAPSTDDQDDELVGGSYGGSMNSNPAFIPMLSATGQ